MDGQKTKKEQRDDETANLSLSLSLCLTAVDSTNTRIATLFIEIFCHDARIPLYHCGRRDRCVR